MSSFFLFAQNPLKENASQSQIQSELHDRRNKPGDSRSDAQGTFRDGSSATGSRGSGGASSCVRSIRSPLSVLSRSSRGINLLREMQRQGIYLSRPLTSRIPANEVPDSFIEQCQTVLQGKSRQLIIRELQRTNLDVNMAVNNLLSMDDEADQAGGGGTASASGAAPGSGSVGGTAGADDWDDETEDLLSILEHHEGHFLLDSDNLVGEELLEPFRFRSDHAQDYEYSFVSDRRKRRRLDSHLYLRSSDIYSNRSGGGNGADSSAVRSNVLDSLRSFNSQAPGESRADDASLQPPPPSLTQQSVQLGSRLEFWTYPPGCFENHLTTPPRFTRIAGLFSELVALSTTGELHQWRWNDQAPYCSGVTSGVATTATSAPVVINSNLGHQSSGCDATEFEKSYQLGSHDQLDRPVHHPRSISLGLITERVVMLSGCATRASVLTASGRLATWMDESLSSLLASAAVSSSSSVPAGMMGSNTGSVRDQQNSATARFEHHAVLFHEMRDERIVGLYTAPLVSVARCASGAVYWWGIYPAYMRQKAMERTRHQKSSLTCTLGSTGVISSTASTSGGGNATAKSSGGSGCGNRYSSGQRSGSGGSVRCTGVTSTSSVGLGAFVCMKSAPIFHAGALGFTVVNGVPMVGTLLEDAWKSTDVCRFRVRTPPSADAKPIALETGEASQLAAITSVSQRSLLGPTNAHDPAQHALTCPHALAALAAAAAAAVGQIDSLTSAAGGGASSHTAASPSSTCGLEHGLSSTGVGGTGTAAAAFQEMPPPPSPASSTCSEQSGPVRVSPGTFKRKKAPSISSERNERGQERVAHDWESAPASVAPTTTASTGNGSRAYRRRSVDRELMGGSSVTGLLPCKRPGTPLGAGGGNSAVAEEDWCLSDVVFVEDGRTQPVGIVLKVDGGIAAVKFLKEQERACLAVGCSYSPTCSLINSVMGGGGGGGAPGLVSTSTVTTKTHSPVCASGSGGTTTPTSAATATASSGSTALPSTSVAGTTSNSTINITAPSQSGNTGGGSGNVPLPVTGATPAMHPVATDPMAWLNVWGEGPFVEDRKIVSSVPGQEGLTEPKEITSSSVKTVRLCFGTGPSVPKCVSFRETM